MLPVVRTRSELHCCGCACCKIFVVICCLCCYQSGISWILCCAIETQCKRYSICRYYVGHFTLVLCWYTVINIKTAMIKTNRHGTFVTLRISDVNIVTKVFKIISIFAFHTCIFCYGVNNIKFNAHQHIGSNRKPSRELDCQSNVHSTT